MQTTASSSSLAGRLTGNAVRDALPSAMTPGSSPSSWLSRSSNHANAPIGASNAFYDEAVSRISSVYKSLAASVHGSFGSDQRRGSSIDFNALVRESKTKDISRLISSTLSSSISSSRTRLASNWSAWQIPSILSGPLDAISSCSYAQPVFERFHIKEPQEQAKFLLASIILGVFIGLIFALVRVMSYYADPYLESHRSRSSCYSTRHQDQDDGRFITTDQPSTWFRRLPRLYGRNVHNSHTMPQYGASGHTTSYDESLNSNDYTDCSAQTSAGDYVKLHHDGKVWRIVFAAGALQNKVVTVEDIRHVAAQLLKIPYLTCFPIVNHFPVPATDGSEDLVDAYTFGWRNGAEGWCHQVGDPLEGGPLSTRNDNREWSGTVEIYTNGNAKNETVAKVWLNHFDTHSSSGKKRRNKKGNKKKSSAQSLRGLRSDFANLSTGKDMGNGASKEMANGRTQHVPSPPPPPQTSAPSGRPHLTTRSLEPPRYNINSTPHPEILALLTRYFTKELKPCMDDYIAAPPTSAKQRDAEYLILNERCERDIVLQLDALVCDGDQDMRARRKSLTNAVHQELKLLDGAVIAAGGKKRGV